MSDGTRVSLIYTPAKDRKIELTALTVGGSGGDKCEDKTVLT